MEIRPSITKEVLINCLQDLISIKYTKKNGDTRIFECTLNEEYITPYVNNTGRHREDDALHITVFEYNLGEWKNLLLDGIDAIYVGENAIPFMIRGV